MITNTKSPSTSPRLNLSPVLRWPATESTGFDLAPEAIVTDARPDYRPAPYRAAVLDIHSSLIIARHLGA